MTPYLNNSEEKVYFIIIFWSLLVINICNSTYQRKSWSGLLCIQKKQMDIRADVCPSCTNFKIQLILIRVDLCPESRHTVSGQTILGLC